MRFLLNNQGILSRNREECNWNKNGCRWWLLKLGDEHMGILILFSLLLLMSDFFHNKKINNFAKQLACTTVLAAEERLLFWSTLPFLGSHTNAPPRVSMRSMLSSESHLSVPAPVISLLICGVHALRWTPKGAAGPGATHNNHHMVMADNWMYRFFFIKQAANHTLTVCEFSIMSGLIGSKK